MFVFQNGDFLAVIYVKRLFLKMADFWQPIQKNTIFKNQKQKFLIFKNNGFLQPIPKKFDF